MTKTHIAKKRFGQNFLHDEYIINEIIRIIHPKPTDLMVEIGPGLGALTAPLIAKVGKLEVVEIDWDIISILQKKFAGQICIDSNQLELQDKPHHPLLVENLEQNNNTQEAVYPLSIHSADALKFDYSFDQQIIRVVGNLPYNISTPLLFHLAQFKNIHDMHFMLQKEVVERICAKPGNKDYGRLSVMLQYKFVCNKMLDVAATCFKPQPKVESAIVRLKPLSPELQYDVDEKALGIVVTHAFGQRRKTIGNSLKNIIKPETFIKLGIDTDMRAENLSVAQYILLANEFMAVKQNKDKK